MNDWIIDFERLNQLTSHVNDGSVDGYNEPLFIYDISRKMIKEYMEFYNEYQDLQSRGVQNTKYPTEEYNMIVETFHYNKILVNRREEKIDSIVSENNI